MITRHYFMCGKVQAEGKMSTRSVMVSFKSWFPDPKYTYKELVKELEKSMGPGLVPTAFNRV